MKAASCFFIFKDAKCDDFYSFKSKKNFITKQFYILETNREGLGKSDSKNVFWAGSGGLCL